MEKKYEDLQKTLWKNLEETQSKLAAKEWENEELKYLLEQDRAQLLRKDTENEQLQEETKKMSAALVEKEKTIQELQAKLVLSANSV